VRHLDHLLDAAELDVLVLQSNWYASPEAKLCGMNAVVLG